MQTYDYRALRKKHKTKKFKTLSDIKNGTWVPLSIAALACGYSHQMLRLLNFKGLIETGKFETGPLLVRVESIPEKLRHS